MKRGRMEINIMRKERVKVEKDEDGWKKEMVYRYGLERRNIKVEGLEDKGMNMKILNKMDENYGFKKIEEELMEIEINNEEGEWKKEMMDN